MNTHIKNFVSNTKDNLHCFQACYAMTWNYFYHTEIPMSNIEKDTNFVINKPTWQFKGMLSLADSGLFIYDIEAFPIELFVTEPENAIKQFVRNKDIENQVISQSDLSQESYFAKQCLDHPNIHFIKKIPTIHDISKYISLNCINIVNVNYHTLLNQEGYFGHFVIVDDIINDTVVLQNPGLPPIQNQTIKMDIFKNAWLFPHNQLANLLVISDSKLE